ncbi:serine aminopeptidase, s33 domain-containing protein [Ditylenchus destructor]|nr:serine aminopeptidase, s33 domain-containing protein [Ditylenchus destructor]
MHCATKNYRLLFCHGLGNAKSDLIACKVQQWALERNIELQSMVYENYGDKRRIWNINDWTKDIKSELDRFSASRSLETGTVIVGNSAASQAVLRAVTDKTCPAVAGLVMISPGVGIKLEHYMERILPGSVEKLSRGEILEHPSADPNLIHNNVTNESMVYENYGDKRRIWNINDWTKDIKSELDRFSASRSPETGTVIVGNSAASQAVLRAVTDKTCPAVAGLVMISPGVGIKLEHYMERILPGSVEKLSRGEILEHPSADPNVCIRVDIKCLEDFVNNCVLRRQNSLEMLKFPVRIVHGLHDKLVPYRNSLELLDKIQSKDKSILLINDGHFVKDQNAIGYALDSLWNSLHEKSVNDKTIDLRRRQFA